MPAVSQAQQRFMAICAHTPSKAKSKCPDKATAREYAQTKRKGLQQKKKA